MRYAVIYHNGRRKFILDEIRIPDAEKMAEGVIKLTIAAGAIPVCHADTGKQSRLGISPACLPDENQRQATGCGDKRGDKKDAKNFRTWAVGEKNNEQF